MATEGVRPGGERRHRIAGLAGWLALSFVVASVGSLASRNAPELYAQLTRPSWAPPAWLFGPVWTTLYVMMAVAGWLVWKAGEWESANTALTLYIAQLVVNTLWSWFFFAWHSGSGAFADIILLVALIVLTMREFARHSRLAAAMLAPYLAWVLFATALTWQVWRLNPDVLR